ncbi:MAG: protein kinase [Verrucomicrobiae bacterium]|nr:protein kinase [Verrucomicrobiae bacterium]
MPESDPLVGQRVSNYEILRRLGQGGMGVVYLARHVTLEREVAIKFLAGQLSNNQDYVDRFLREARSAARLNHPNIISVYDAGSQDDVYYFVMEYVEGQDFSRLLKQVKQFPELEAIGHVRKAADAMAYAHQEGIIHRDLKPENLILTRSGEVKVGDLGLAKEVSAAESSLTLSGVVMGTPFYISPEQVRGARDVDHRTDIYSLGATLYHLVTGVVPYRGTSPAEIMSKHLTEPFPWPQAIHAELSEGACRVMYKMMAKEPEERFQSMREVSQVLGELASGQATQVVAGIEISASGIATASQMGATQVGALPSAFGASGPAPGAAPSAVGGQSAAGAPQPSIYTMPPTEVATRLGGIIGVSVVIGCLLIGGILWFALGGKKRPPSPAQPSGQLTEAEKKEKEALDAMREAARKTAARMNVLDELEEKQAKETVAKAFSGKDEKPLPENPKAPPLPPPETPPTSSAAVPSPPAAEKAAPAAPEKPVELAMAKPPAPIPTPTPFAPQFLVESDFESDVIGGLPKLWRAYAQEAKAKEAVWATSATYDLPGGGKTGWDVLKTEEAHGGRHVLRVMASAPPGQPLQYRCGITTAIRVDAGKKYTAAFWLRAARDHVKASVKFGRAPTIKEFGVDLIDEWKEISIAMEPNATMDVGLSIILTSPGEMWVDDIRVAVRN